jgi:hypothetical protein
MAIHATEQTKNMILDAIKKLVYRAEQQASYLENFVPIVGFAKLSTANTEILYGRNGTGKTHFFRAFQQHCYDDFELSKVLPVYIDCRLLDIGSLGSEILLERLLTIFYKRLIRKILTDLKEFSDQVITVGTLQRLFGGEGRDRRKNIDASLANLQRLLDEGLIDESVKSYVRKVENESTGATKISGGLTFSAGVSERHMNGEARAKVELGASVASQNKKKLETIYNGLAIIDYDQIRSLIDTIIENSGAKSVTVLIDEWSDLPRDVQPLIAEMIKKTLGTSQFIHLKIAALKFFCWPSAELGDGQRIGMTRANLSVFADLDALLRYEAQEQAVKDFLTAMLYKHLVALEPNLRDISLVDFENVLCGTVFDGDGAYQELIRSSEGNPRDFLRLLTSCCQRAELDSGKPISERAVLDGAIRHFQDDKQPEIAHDATLTGAFDRLFQLVIKSGSKLFAVSSELSEQNDILRELWHYRFIHLVQSRLPIFADDIVKEYDIYTMDYGKLLSLKLTQEGDKQFKKIEKATELFCLIIPNNFGPIMETICKMILKSEILGGSLRRMLGRSAVARQGVERGSFEGIEQLITNGGVADEILSSATAKPLAPKKRPAGRRLAHK